MFSLITVTTYAETFTVTAFCKCSICCGKWSKYHLTASGVKPMEGRTCAAPRSIPFGTKFWIEGVGIRIAEDRLSRRYDSRLDIYFNSHAKAERFGKRRLNVVAYKAK